MKEINIIHLFLTKYNRYVFLLIAYQLNIKYSRNRQFTQSYYYYVNVLYYCAGRCMYNKTKQRNSYPFTSTSVSRYVRNMYTKVTKFRRLLLLKVGTPIMLLMPFQ